MQKNSFKLLSVFINLVLGILLWSPDLGLKPLIMISHQTYEKIIKMLSLNNLKAKT